MISRNQVFSRGIRSVRPVEYRENSPNHQAGFVIEPGNWEVADPFLIMAEDFFKRGTFGMHPHRGIETVTFVVNGRLEHIDNKGNQEELMAGDVQWMTAGRGIIHAEEPAVGETVHSLQLWINLPSDKKMTEPRYQNLRGKDMPVRQEDGATVRIFSGSSYGKKADTKNYVPVTMVDITLEPGRSITQDLPGEYNGFLYILKGSGIFGSSKTEGRKGQVLWLERGKDAQMSEVLIRADEELHVMLYAGKPVNEKIAARGPFVMNSEEEIAQAYKDYREGKFT
ncbi:pirin family protein [Siminovitchia sediminis]|uniref:Pirin family protein n=1 Tax=Siminovitchia sediminis TaxID=1274353 RepID=A0ABW4KLJ4_9BACI